MKSHRRPPMELDPGYHPNPELPSPRFPFFSVDFGDLVNATLVLSTVLRPEGFRTDLAQISPILPGVARRGDKLRGAPVRISRILRPDILRPTTVIAQEVCVAALHQAGPLNPARRETVDDESEELVSGSALLGEVVGLALERLLGQSRYSSCRRTQYGPWPFSSRPLSTRSRY